MTNVSATPRKIATRRGLFALAEDALRKEGWSVVRVPRGGKSSLRMIVRGDECYKVSIRTSQDAWIAFPRKTAADGWITLDEVDFVVAASVNDKHSPTQARVHMIPGDEARDRFNRAYAAREAAGHTLPVGRGIWLSLYDEDSPEPVTHVGAGMGLAYPPIAVVDLTKAGLPSAEGIDYNDLLVPPLPAPRPAEPPLTISDAKRRLAASLGVPESAIKIFIEH